MRRLSIGVWSGLLGGSLLGMLEALWVLSNVGSKSDYLALFYATVLYGLLGAAAGVGTGALLAALHALRPNLPSEPTAYTLGLLAPLLGLGGLIARETTDELLYAGTGVPGSATALIAALFVVLGGVGLFLGPILLQKTPLRILLEPHGSGGAWTAMVGLTAVFSYAPAGDDVNAPRPMHKPQEELRERPNVLLLVVSSLRADEGSPALEELARDGVVFERAHAHATWTRGSFASLLSGMLPPAHGVRASADRLPGEVQTLAEQLSAHNYTTVGLPNADGITAIFGFAQGFDAWTWLAPELPLRASESVSRLTLYRRLREAGLLGPGGAPHQPAAVALELARTWIQAQGEERWFLVVHLREPELGEFSELDGELSSFLQWLRDGGLYAGTAILLTADHGREKGEHGGAGHGDTLYEEQLHVPLVLKLPDQHQAGRRVEAVVRLIDVAPTLAALAGAPIPEGWQGRSLVDPAFFSDEALDPRALDRRVFADQRVGGAELSAVIVGDGKLVLASPGNARGLPERAIYDLEADPGETTPIEDESRESELRRALEQERGRAHPLRPGYMGAE